MGAAGAAAATAAVSYPGKPTTGQTKFRWNLVHSFGPTAPVLGTNLPAMADELREMSGGALDVKVFGAGELVPAFGVFDAVSEGSAQMYYSIEYYFAGKEPAAQFFGTVPFGMNPQQVSAWLYHGGGLDIWREIYERKHNMITFPAGNTGQQMGGWFRKEIKSLDDMKGLKFRVPGLAGKIYSKIGTTVTLLPGPEIFPALERGVIDGAEWVGPFYDWNLGLHQAAEYYYSPGWQEPSAQNNLNVNLQAWKSLPAELKQMVEHAAFKLDRLNLAEFDAKNQAHVEKLADYGVKFRTFPDEVLQGMYKAALEVNEEVAATSEDTRKVWESYKSFMDSVRDFYSISEYAYISALRTVGAV